MEKESYEYYYLLSNRIESFDLQSFLKFILKEVWEFEFRYVIKDRRKFDSLNFYFWSEKSAKTPTVNIKKISEIQKIDKYVIPERIDFKNSDFFIIFSYPLTWKIETDFCIFIVTKIDEKDNIFLLNSFPELPEKMFHFLKPEIYCEGIERTCPFKEDIDFDYINSCLKFKKYPLL